MALKNNKSLGQHWLKNRAILEEIAELTVFDDVETAVEIGPGLGTLTSSLLRRFKKVVAIEFDAELARKLPGSFPGKNLKVINDDILKTDFAQLGLDEDFVVAGNIPYYITSPIINRLLALDKKPKRIVLLIQKEVAERLAAEPGDYSILALGAQNLAEVELGPVVLAEEFTPPPKVDSQVVILTPYENPVVDPKCLELAKIGFLAPRKKLVANLASGTGTSKEEWRGRLEGLGVNPDARAEDLSLYDWERLAERS